MYFDTVALLVLLVTLLLGLIVFLIHQLVSAKDHHIQSLTAERNALRDELDNLISRKRHPGPTLAGIEDIQAALIRIKFDRQYQDELLDASLNTLGQIRKGPYNYNPDTPCVKQKRSQTTPAQNQRQETLARKDPK